MFEKDGVIDVSKFYSLNNEENGVWFEAEIGRRGTGIEFLVYGPNSKKAWVASNHYAKALEELEDLDEEERRNKGNEYLVDAVVEIVKDVRGKNGKKLMAGDKELTVADVKDMFINSPMLALAVWDFHKRSEGFLEGKKKN